MLAWQFSMESRLTRTSYIFIIGFANLQMDKSVLGESFGLVHLKWVFPFIGKKQLQLFHQNTPRKAYTLCVHFEAVFHSKRSDMRKNCCFFVIIFDLGVFLLLYYCHTPISIRLSWSDTIVMITIFLLLNPSLNTQTSMNNESQPKNSLQYF